jgi:hypothetical protein
MLTIILVAIGAGIGLYTACSTSMDSGIFIKIAFPAIGGFVFYMGSLLLK